MDTYGAGVVVFLLNQQGKLLLGKRKGSHGAGTWSLPGGKVDFMEHAMDCAVRELKEETGLIIKPELVYPLGWLDNIWFDPDKGQQHWITLFTEARHYSDDEPEVMEPEKCEEWRWVEPESIRSDMSKGENKPEARDYPLFYPLEEYFKRFGVMWP